MSMPKSLYLDVDDGSHLQSRVKVNNSFKKFFVTLFIAIVGMFFAVQGSLPQVLGNSSSSSHTAKAGAFGGVLCGDENTLGTMMNPHPWQNIFAWSADTNASGRSWTLQEAFGNNVLFADYAGEGGSGTWLTQDVGDKRGEKAVKNFSTVEPTLAKDRNALNCTLGDFTTFAADMPLGVSTVITGVTSTVVVMVFDSKLICTNDTTTTDSNGAVNAKQNNCFDLVAILGGKSSGVSHDGIIGSLTSNLYMPLVTLAAVATGVWVLYKGLGQRKYREALFGFGWCVGSFVIGLAILLHPNLLAKTPMALSNTLSSCVVGAFNGGGSCTGGDNNATGDGKSNVSEGTSQAICNSTAQGVGSEEAMAMTMDGLTCQIWKAFVLEPYSNASFGKSFETLDVTDPDTKKAISKAGVNPNDLCVSLHSTKSMDDMGSTLELTGSATSAPNVCNLAAYQLYLMTNATSGSDKPNTTGALDTRWYKLIVPVASDPAMWSQWHMTWATGFDKIATATVGLLTTILGCALIIVISFYALIFYLTSIVMMAFAPIFFLIGVHPGRGRNILKGWGEIVLSNVLKYVVSAVFLIVSLSLYAGILGNMTNIGLTLIFVVMMTAALWLYRKEVIDLLGRVNMGGERLTNLNNNQGMDRLKRLGRNTGGSAIGSVMANGQGAFSKDTYKAAWTGAQDGAMRDLKRGNGMLAGGLREYDRARKDNRNDLRREANQMSQNANTKETMAAQQENIVQQSQAEMDSAEATLVEQQAEYNEAVSNERTAQGIENKVLMDMSAENPVFAKLQALTNQLGNLELRRQVALNVGDTELVRTLDDQIAAVSAQRDVVANNITPAARAAAEEKYENRVRAEFNREGLIGYETRSDKYLDIVSGYAGAKNALDNAYARRGEALDKYNEYKAEANSDRAASNYMLGELESLGFDGGYTLDKKNEIRAHAAELGAAVAGNGAIVAGDKPVTADVDKFANIPINTAIIDDATNGTAYIGGVERAGRFDKLDPTSGVNRFPTDNNALPTLTSVDKDGNPTFEYDNEAPILDANGNPVPTDDLRTSGRLPYGHNLDDIERMNYDGTLDHGAWGEIDPDAGYGGSLPPLDDVETDDDKPVIVDGQMPLFDDAQGAPTTDSDNIPPHDDSNGNPFGKTNPFEGINNKFPEINNNTDENGTTNNDNIITDENETFDANNNPLITDDLRNSGRLPYGHNLDDIERINGTGENTPNASISDDDALPTLDEVDNDAPIQDTLFNDVTPNNDENIGTGNSDNDEVIPPNNGNPFKAGDNNTMPTINNDDINTQDDTTTSDDSQSGGTEVTPGTPIEGAGTTISPDLRNENIVHSPDNSDGEWVNDTLPGLEDLGDETSNNNTSNTSGEPVQDTLFDVNPSETSPNNDKPFNSGDNNIMPKINDTRNDDSAQQTSNNEASSQDDSGVASSNIGQGETTADDLRRDEVNNTSRTDTGNTTPNTSVQDDTTSATDSNNSSVNNPPAANPSSEERREESSKPSNTFAPRNEESEKKSDSNGNVFNTGANNVMPKITNTFKEDDSASEPKLTENPRMGRTAVGGHSDTAGAHRAPSADEIKAANEKIASETKPNDEIKQTPNVEDAKPVVKDDTPPIREEKKDDKKPIIGGKVTNKFPRISDLRTSRNPVNEDNEDKRPKPRITLDDLNPNNDKKAPEDNKDQKKISDFFKD